jgi:hypothetical protein
LVCLGDGIRRDEWAWLREQWSLAFAPAPRRTRGATLVWSDAALRNQLNEFLRARTWFSHRLLSSLMELGAPVQSTVRVESLSKAAGPLLVLNPHLFPADELARVFSYRHGPIVAIGRKVLTMPRPESEFEDVYAPEPLWCGVYGTKLPQRPKIEREGDQPPAVDPLTAPEPLGYWDHLSCRRVSQGFLRACSQTVQKTSGAFAMLAEEDAVTLMAQEQADGKLRLAIKNKRDVYARPQIDLARPIQDIEILTSFPSVLIRPQGSKLSVRVPGKGIVVLEITLADRPRQ